MPEQPENGTLPEQPEESELIKEMLGDEEVEPPQEPEKPEVVKDEPKEPTITEEFAKRHGLPKGFVGKPIEEIGKAYKEANKTISKLGQERANLEKQISEISNKTTKSTFKEKLDELPDPIDDLEGFREKMAVLLEEVREASKPQPKSPEEVFIAELSSRLPKGVDIEQLIEDFRWDNEDEIAEMQSEYQKAPRLLVRDIVKYHTQKEKEKDSKQSTKEKHEKVVNKFEKPKTSSNISSQSRVQPQESSLIKEMLENLTP